MRCARTMDQHGDPIKVWWDPELIKKCKLMPIWMLRPEEFVVCPNLGVYQTSASYRTELENYGFTGVPPAKLNNPAGFKDDRFYSGGFKSQVKGIVFHEFFKEATIQLGASTTPSHLVGSRGRSQSRPRAQAKSSGEWQQSGGWQQYGGGGAGGWQQSGGGGASSGAAWSKEGAIQMMQSLTLARDEVIDRLRRALELDNDTRQEIENLREQIQLREKELAPSER